MNKECSQDAFVTLSSCPLCQREMTINWYKDNIPYFEDVMYITACCECSFRFADTIILTQKEPIKYELVLKQPEDLYAKVVRSTSGTIKIPELGIAVEPGSTSESYITNIEGVLDRILAVVQTATRWVVDEPEKYDHGIKLQNLIQEAMEGKRELTIIIEDPLGNSAIISDRSISTKLTHKEMKNLKTGMIIFDAETAGIEIDACNEHNLAE